ncbi:MULTISPECIES: DUF397 domain-containing protein [Streptomyces]|jgi:hypothetical protein|uniref:DUF397 domain-containing protein n=2 Tax=Streptomyces griseoaurantiacus TaxID=68213 RepID=A0ABZ1V3K4_9ACTN|nr:MULTISPECIES: DUF397 domain-containing protein [Streptomyces]MBA5226127.1 DUF397 domain-containing protein [Streptomyces griseoaurantiacus]MCF0088303.1 hypothetical protein [Streptomyces sp. MH192]MCF0100554.1 hypothetical protein [Streptomyces sp. MH191]MDX3089041.1 DUF397 domain-containing protein [Streptomyces sp. ME12-02E]MDX3330369.1 DUF397 domain-containing protein [Streptomyces sp. ME02-6978a]
MGTQLIWQKSSYSGGGDGNACVELAAATPANLHLRESEQPDTRLTTTPLAVARLLHHIRSGGDA